MSWWGGVNTDYLAWGPRLPTPGTGVEGKAFYVGPGGKGATQAVAAARLGARVTLLARLGGDEHGEALLAHLTREGVDTSVAFAKPAISCVTGPRAPANAARPAAAGHGRLHP
jgi:ribokinase